MSIHLRRFGAGIIFMITAGIVGVFLTLIFSGILEALQPEQLSIVLVFVILLIVALVYAYGWLVFNVAGMFKK